VRVNLFRDHRQTIQAGPLRTQSISMLLICCRCSVHPTSGCPCTRTS
jgi:hypothetical protein